MKATLLRMLRGWPTFLIVAYTLLGWPLGIWLLTRPDAWLNALGVLLSAHTLIYSAYLIHDCAHHAIFSTRSANDRLGILMSWINGACLANYARLKKKHLRHHSDRLDVVTFDYRAALNRLPASMRRGVLALEIDVKAQGGHSSRADHMRAPIADLSRLAVAYDTWGRAHRTKGPPGFTGMCVNLAKMEGGVAFNMVPAQATLCVSFRCPPDANPRLLRAELEAIARGLIPDAVIRAPVDHAPFHTRELAAFEPWLGDIARAPIDLGYWTEAALLSEAGIDAVVFGPGDIAQAHAADEWVEIEQLERARRIFAGVFRGTRARAGR